MCERDRERERQPERKKERNIDSMGVSSPVSYVQKVLIHFMKCDTFRNEARLLEHTV